MAQVTIYLPDDVLKHVKREAKRMKLSVSAYLSLLASRAARPPSWPPDFDSLYGSCPDLEEPLDLQATPVDSL